MTDLILRIGGREFSVACAPGEEAHIHRLSAMIDGKLRAMNVGTGLSEGRMMLFAALLLADDLHEVQRSGGGGAPDTKADAEAGTGPPAAAPVRGLSADRLEHIALRLENCATLLERRPIPT